MPLVRRRHLHRLQLQHRTNELLLVHQQRLSCGIACQCPSSCSLQPFNINTAREVFVLHGGTPRTCGASNSGCGLRLSFCT